MRAIVGFAWPFSGFSDPVPPARKLDSSMRTRGEDLDPAYLPDLFTVGPGMQIQAVCSVSKRRTRKSAADGSEKNQRAWRSGESSVVSHK